MVPDRKSILLSNPEIASPKGHEEEESLSRRQVPATPSSELDLPQAPIPKTPSKDDIMYRHFAVRASVPWIAWLALPTPMEARKRWYIDPVSLRIMAAVAAQFVQELDFSRGTFHSTTYIPNMNNPQSPTMAPWYIRLDWHNFLFRPSIFRWTPRNKLIVREADYINDYKKSLVNDARILQLRQGVDNPGPIFHPGLLSDYRLRIPHTFGPKPVFKNQTLEQWIHHAVKNRLSFATAVSKDKSYWIQFRVFPYKPPNADDGAPGEHKGLCQWLWRSFNLRHPQFCAKHPKTMVEDTELEPLGGSVPALPKGPAPNSNLPRPGRGNPA
ncbi:MAG: hypothetical protein M1837_004744 [Sclerophora amabilis]|nr:MAG: hypothetical protein M1837_004744 [Sclerophora amabilis]